MKKVILRLLILLNIPGISRFMFQRRSISVIYYHDIDSESFDTHLRFLKKKYNVIDRKTLQEYLDKRINKLPKYSLLITFDDGHIGNYSLLNSFIKYDVKPIIFLTSALIDSSNAYWFNLPFKNLSVKDELKKVTDTERRAYLEMEFDENILHPGPQSLTKDMLLAMIPYVDFQSHTVDHPCLPNCSSEESQNQILKSKSDIEAITGAPVVAIAYPNGDFTIREIEICKNAGYTMGFASSSGFVHRKSNPFTINRLSINDTKNFNEFVLRVTGVWSFLKRMKIK
jgi:peptidoglycan/xylan/chitin deacetylase (PgdA/CDA1 family)